MEVLNHFDHIDESVDDTTITNDNVGVVLEEAEIIDCDTEIDNVTEEDNIQYQICEVNRNDNAVAYRVVQVGEGQANNTELSLTTPLNNTVQVLTSPINGQLYVLSNSNEVVTTESARTVTPRVKLQIDNPQNILTTIKKRDERRRVTHNEVERRRRDKINNWISKLGKLLPDYEQTTTGEGDVKTNFELQSKGGILERACEYITELQDVQENFSQSLDENAQLLEEAKTLRQVVNQLKKENSELKAQISKSTTYILGT
ncbi:PREDICTED: upstream stimulatory factor 1-like [Dufourea novaeangliae]|uniref:Upstream stimulatory factor 2 n=1 Tax=Dufourea novaeangliae TaxID=178035 RepID=A0A154P2A6_DUFNO|nr:PREDICTED: upstream stimulatory factor 1-like [Dufourea novaeangliae]KZC05260.1 Upstream stimulatory factor 2 [Dufourea novaeangliae]